MGSFIDLALFLLLLATGYVVGRIIEQRHYASIRLRERRYRDVLAFPMRFAPDSVTPQQAFLVHGTVVVSADYFKTFVAGLRNLVGGRFRSYETLLERARREALLRLKEDARARGARLVVCVRFETTSIASGWAPAIEVLAYGTALIPVRAEAPAARPAAALASDRRIEAARSLPRPA
jgi:uncharacterized protein YbjQ (UPF0145 family)